MLSTKSKTPILPMSLDGSVEKSSTVLSKCYKGFLGLCVAFVLFYYGINASMFLMIGLMLVRTVFFVLKLNLREKIKKIVYDELNPYTLTFKHSIKYKKSLFVVVGILVIDWICAIIRSRILLNFIKYMDNMNHIVIACVVYVLLGIVKKLLNEVNSRYHRQLNIMITSSIKEYVMGRLTNQSYDNISRKKSELFRLMGKAQQVPRTITFMSVNMISSSLSIVKNVANYYLLNTLAANFILISSVMFYWLYGWNAVSNYTTKSNDRSKLASEFYKTYGREMRLVDEGVRDQDCYALPSETTRLVNKSKEFSLKCLFERKDSVLFYLYQNLFSDGQWLLVIISFLIQSYQFGSDTKLIHAGMTNLIMITNDNLRTISWFLMEYSRLVEIISEWAPLKEFILKNDQERVMYSPYEMDAFETMKIDLVLTLPRKEKDPIVIRTKTQLRIDRGDKIMFSGESGRGKSSFSKALASYYPAEWVNQTIFINDRLVEHGCYDLVPNVVIVNQEIALSFDDTIRNIIKMGTDVDEEYVTVAELIHLCELSDLEWTPTETEKRENTLSGGQKTRLKLAYSLNKILYYSRKNGTSPIILILDEIDSGLKKGHMIVNIQGNILQLREFENTAIISIVHNPDCVEHLYNKSWMVEDRTVFVME